MLEPDLHIRIGIGRDLHRLAPRRGLAAGRRLAPRRRLVVGGVPIQSDRGPVAHSDGDALLHAIIDAMLGAAGLGDIGDHFPDTDPQYANADSRDLLRKTARLLARNRLRVTQVDATVGLERPKLGALKLAMRNRIAADLGLSPACVNVKAKTGERLGPVGRRQAIEADAIVVLMRTAPAISKKQGAGKRKRR